MKNAKTLIAALLASLVLALTLGCEQPQPPRHRQDQKKVLPVPPAPKPAPKVRVLAFTASWCGPCKASKPYLAQIKAQGVDVEIVDIDGRPDLAHQYNITSVPTFFVYINGKQVEQTHDIMVVVSLTKNES